MTELDTDSISALSSAKHKYHRSTAIWDTSVYTSKECIRHDPVKEKLITPAAQIMLPILYRDAAFWDAGMPLIFIINCTQTMHLSNKLQFKTYIV